YQIRYRLGGSLTEADFPTANPGPVVAPGMPGAPAEFELTQHEGIQALHTVTIGLRAIGYCQQASPLATVTVTTPRQKFQTIQGCFVATAAFGSPLAAEVVALRAARDRLLAPSRLGRALIRLYYAASPPLAALIARDEALRAAARALLAPGVKL